MPEQEEQEIDEFERETNLRKARMAKVKTGAKKMARYETKERLVKKPIRKAMGHILRQEGLRTVMLIIVFLVALISDLSDWILKTVQILMVALGITLPIAAFIEAIDEIIDAVTTAILVPFFAIAFGGLWNLATLAQTIAGAFELIPGLVINDLIPSYTIAVIAGILLLRRRERKERERIETSETAQTAQIMTAKTEVEEE